MSRYSGLAEAMSVVADKLKKDREMQVETGQKINLLGIEGLIKGNIEPAKQEETGTTFDIPGMGRMKPVEQMEAVVNPVTGQIEYSVPKKSVFKPKTNEGGKILSSPMVDKISKNEDAYSTLGDAAINLQANKDRFSQFLGPGKGVLRNPIRSYGNKDLQDFLGWKANVQDAFQQYRVVVTGAQASDKEIALLAKNRPTENDTYEVFTKKTNEVRRVGNQVLTRYINNLGKAGYNVSGYQDTLDRLNEELGNFGGNQNISSDIVTIQDITGKTIQIPRDEAIKKGYING